MKKIKKWLFPLLVILLIPLTLAGCSSKQTVASSKDRVWYLFTDASEPKWLDDIIIINGNQVTDYGIGTNLPYKDFKGKNADQVKEFIEKYNKKVSEDDTIPSTKYKVTYDVYTDDNGKPVIEGLMTQDERPLIALKGKESVTVDGSKLYGFRSIKDGGGYTTLLQNELLVTNDKNIALDTKGKNINQYKVSDYSNFVTQDNDN